MIHGFAARARRLDGYGQILFHLILSDELGQPLRAQLQLKRGIVLDRRCRHDPFLQVGSVLQSSHGKAMVKRKDAGSNARFQGIDAAVADWIIPRRIGPSFAGSNHASERPNHELADCRGNR